MVINCPRNYLRHCPRSRASRDGKHVLVRSGSDQDYQALAIQQIEQFLRRSAGMFVTYFPLPYDGQAGFEHVGQHRLAQLKTLTQGPNLFDVVIGNPLWLAEPASTPVAKCYALLKRLCSFIATIVKHSPLRYTA